MFLLLAKDYAFYLYIFSIFTLLFIIKQSTPKQLTILSEKMAGWVWKTTTVSIMAGKTVHIKDIYQMKRQE